MHFPATKAVRAAQMHEVTLTHELFKAMAVTISGVRDMTAPGNT